MTQSKGSLFGAAMLVAGTCIGGGMLILPVATGRAGFLPAMIMMIVGWAFMTVTALFLTEINLWMEEGSHIITMASRLLGKPGKVAAWLLYLFISYASLVAYTAGCGELVKIAFQAAFGVTLSISLAFLIFMILFGIVIYLGNIFLGRVNSLLMVGLVVSYILLIAFGSSEVKWDFLYYVEWRHIYLAVPIFLTIFSFQTIVPSLTIYLKRDASALRTSIILGTFISFLFYASWQWLVLGSVPVAGECGLQAAFEEGKSASEFCLAALRNPWVKTFANFFAFFALVTSFLGMSLGLFDFLADGLKISKKGLGKLGLGLLVAVPTLIFALSLKRIFYLALDMTGGIGDSLLNGLLPALMLWVGRYSKGYKSEYQIPGGRPLILAIMAYAIFVLTVEILGKFQLFSYS